MTGANYAIRIYVSAPDGTEYQTVGNIDEDLRLEICDPELWWPNGLGSQPLYKVSCFLVYKEEDEDNTVIDEWSNMIGLRTLTVDQHADDWGETFQFLVNGTAIFARGANYIPEDVYLTRTSREKTEKLIRACCEANFNCIRVWGGGVYPDDYFYDLCDQYGLIVWQDCMFACAIYDIKNDNFLADISAEIRDNLLRIRHHASLGLICGNNEMEWFFTDYDTFFQTKEHEYEYLKQYHMAIPAIVEEVCQEVFYWTSSPSSGGYFDKPNDPDRGDCHYWAVWHGNKDFIEYTKHYFRFMSEFGFESFPSMKTIAAFAEVEDMNIFSPVMEDHQRRIGGNGKILNYIARYFRYPKDLDSLIYVSQLSQSEALRHGIEHWRRNRGRCMGSIYWQLNDNWPVASWSSIDYYGRWKSLHYMVKRAYHNTLISCSDNGDDTVGIWLSNENSTEIEGELEWQLVTLLGDILEQGSTEVKAGEAGAFTSKQLLELDCKPLQIQGDGYGTPERECMLFFTFITAGGEKFYGSHCFAPWKSLSLQNPGLTAAVESRDDAIVVMIEAQYPALFVELDLAGGDCIFSDNYFD
ncbi:MAG: glycoside hydrolase family 2 protein, partial [Bacteroidia bacterium]|nr:glycoside hydrolase family 2 protein [Bacteroidia bacterium]